VIEETGGTIEYSREYRPTFDEVFAALVTAHVNRDKTGGAGASPLLPTQPMARPR
jgi:hypothetical protein